MMQQHFACWTLGLMMLSAHATGAEFTLHNAWLEVRGDAAGVASLRYDPAGQGHYRRNLLREGESAITWTADSQPVRMMEAKPGEGGLNVRLRNREEKSEIRLELKDQELRTMLITPDGVATVGARVTLPFRRTGYFDRATGTLQKPDEPAAWPFKRFTNLRTGHCVAVEMFMRQPSAWPFGRNWLENEGGGRTLAQGLDGYDVTFQFDHPMFFITRDDALVLASEGGRKREFSCNFAFRAASPRVELDGGHRLPWIDVQTSRTIKTSTGAVYEVAPLANDLFQEALNWYADHNANGAWGDWTVKSFAWTDTLWRDRQAKQLLAWPVGDDGYGRDGYAYTWLEQRGWPFPENTDSRHTGTNALLIAAAWRYYCWTGDLGFLKQIAPKLRRAMDYQLEYLHAREEGIVNSDSKFGPNRGGRAGKDIGTNFYDIQPFGGRDAYATILYYRSLRAMGEIERALGHPLKAREYTTRLMPASRKAFNRVFWREDLGRYLACIDVDGNAIDFGHTFLQLEAIEAGLVDDTRARRIFAWLDDPSTDTYTRWKFAARHNTIDNKTWWPPFGPFKWASWSDQVQNGGALLAESSFDLIARSRAQGAEGLGRRYWEILERYAEPDKLTGGDPLYFGEKQQGGDYGPGAVGVMTNEFPETALLSEAMFESVLGLHIDAWGLTLAPVLPPWLESFTIHELAWRGARWTVTAHRGGLKLECTAAPIGSVFRVNGARYDGVFKADMETHGGQTVRLTMAEQNP